MSAVSKHRVLILGGTGYIGSTLVRLLNDSEGFECYALVRSTSKYIPALKQFCNNVIVCGANGITKNDIMTALNHHSINCVVSIISFEDMSDEKERFEINKVAKKFIDNLLNAAYEYDPTMLVITTSGNFSLWTDNMKDINISPSSATVVAPNKYKNRYFANHFGQIPVDVPNDDYILNNFINNGYNVVIAYPCSIYGPSVIHRNGFWDSFFMDLINNKEGLSGNMLMKYVFTSWIDVRDCAKAYQHIIQYGEKNNYYLIGHERYSVCEIAIKLAQCSDLRYPEMNKKYFLDHYTVPIDCGIRYDAHTTNKKLNFKPIYSLNDEKTLKQWINVLNEHYFDTTKKSKL